MKYQATVEDGVELSAWMRERIGASIRLVHRVAPEYVDHPRGSAHVPLGGKRTQPGAREDRCCDRCDAYVPPGEILTSVVLWPVSWLCITGGLCAKCAAAEGGASC